MHSRRKIFIVLLINLGVFLLALEGARVACADGWTKPRMLQVLRQLTKRPLDQQAARFAQDNPQEALQLVLDLAFYTWAAHMLGIAQDISSAYDIISALARVHTNPMAAWAADYFRIDKIEDTDIAMPPKEGSNASDLFRLKTQFEAALAYRESSRLEVVDALLDVSRLCSKMSLDISEALVSKLLGDVYCYDLERLSTAEAYYERAAWTFAAYRCRAALALTHEDWGMLSSSAGRYSGASRHYVEAARQWEQLAKEEPKTPRHLESAGLAYMKAGEAQMAAGDAATGLQLMRSKALPFLRSYSELTRSYGSLIRALFKLGEVRRTLGDPLDALTILKQAQIACEREADPLLTARLYDELDKTYAALSQPANQVAARSKRLRVLSEAGAKGDAASQELLRRAAQSQPADPGSLALAERGALAYQTLGDNQRAAALWSSLAEVYKKSGQVDQQLRCLRSLASCLESDGEFEKALDVRRDAVILARAARLSEVAAEIVQDIVDSFISRGDVSNALEGFTELVPIVEETGNVRGAARVLESRAALLAENKRYEAAVDDYKLAIKRYVDQAGDIWSGAQTALSLAKVQVDAGQTDAASVTLEDAIRRIETVYGAEGSEREWGTERTQLLAALYKELARLYIRLSDERRATLLFSKARNYSWFGRVVLELASDVSEPAVARWAKTIQLAPPEGLLISAEGSVDKASGTDWAQYALACWWLESQYPREYAALPVNPLDMVRFRSRLSTESALIEYLVTESSLYVFTCTTSAAVCRQIAVNRAAVDSAVDRLRRVLRDCEDNLAAGIPVPGITNWQEPAFLEVRRPLAELYSLLLAPLVDLLQGKSRLIFALPTELQGIPMHALVCADNGARPQFVINNFQVGYVGRGMLNLVTGDAADSVDPKTDWVWIFADPEGNLPGARKEAENVKEAYMWSRWFVGPERATSTNFLDALAHGGILHVAAHHRIDANPSGFQLRLAPDSKSDGIVGVQELSRVNLANVKLIVLSACETVGSLDPISTGPTKTAELFTLAGAHAVIGGAWKVSDEAASEAMGRFYRQLSAGKSRAESLRMAMLGMIESNRYAHPFYWACFVLYGNPN
ncbi:MAG: CHAT domain-containing protein [Armatimonadota bacterium]|nr:CHAT domain-containing protein [Armatimonadota bacterium]